MATGSSLVTSLLTSVQWPTTSPRHFVRHKFTKTDKQIQVALVVFLIASPSSLSRDQPFDFPANRPSPRIEGLPTWHRRKSLPNGVSFAPAIQVLQICAGPEPPPRVHQWHLFVLQSLTNHRIEEEEEDETSSEEESDDAPVPVVVAPRKKFEDEEDESDVRFARISRS